MPSEHIQWFPGHMAKTRRLITENLKNVHIIIEVLDADLNFQGDTLIRYETHRASEDAFVFGIATSNESRYKVNGLVKQIKQNHEQAKT